MRFIHSYFCSFECPLPVFMACLSTSVPHTPTLCLAESLSQASSFQSSIRPYNSSIINNSNKDSTTSSSSVTINGRKVIIPHLSSSTPESEAAASAAEGGGIAAGIVPAAPAPGAATATASTVGYQRGSAQIQTNYISTSSRSLSITKPKPPSPPHSSTSLSLVSPKSRTSPPPLPIPGAQPVPGESNSQAGKMAGQGVTGQGALLVTAGASALLQSHPPATSPVVPLSASQLSSVSSVASSTGRINKVMSGVASGPGSAYSGSAEDNQEGKGGGEGLDLQHRDASWKDSMDDDDLDDFASAGGGEWCPSAWDPGWASNKCSPLP